MCKTILSSFIQVPNILHNATTGNYSNIVILLNSFKLLLQWLCIALDGSLA